MSATFTGWVVTFFTFFKVYGCWRSYRRCRSRYAGAMQRHRTESLLSTADLNARSTLRTGQRRLIQLCFAVFLLAFAHVLSACEQNREIRSPTVMLTPTSTLTPTPTSTPSPTSWPTLTPIPTLTPWPTPSRPSTPLVTIVQIVHTPTRVQVGTLVDEYLVLVSFAELVNLSGWTIVDSQGDVYTFGSIVIEAGTGLRVHTGSGKDGPEDVYWGLDRTIWNEQATNLVLRDARGFVIDKYSSCPP